MEAWWSWSWTRRRRWWLWTSAWTSSSWLQRLGATLVYGSVFQCWTCTPPSNWLSSASPKCKCCEEKDTFSIKHKYLIKITRLFVILNIARKPPKKLTKIVTQSPHFFGTRDSQKGGLRYLGKIPKQSRNFSTRAYLRHSWSMPIATKMHTLKRLHEIISIIMGPH